jgi:hypothetical protein
LSRRWGSHLQECEGAFQVRSFTFLLLRRLREQESGIGTSFLLFGRSGSTIERRSLVTKAAALEIGGTSNTDLSSWSK